MSQQRPVQPLSAIQRFVAAPTDVNAELAADQNTPQLPLRFAVGQSVSMTPATTGTWEQVPEGRLWRLRIVSAGATDLNLGFSRFWLPAGATLHLLAEGDSYYQGPYSAEDNGPHGQLWTAVVPGEAAVIELFVPSSATAEPLLLLSQINCGYRDLFHRTGARGIAKAEGCEIDVVCPIAAGWSNEVRSVARYSILGTAICTGTLLMDAAGDFRNFFLTANHCGLDPGNAASVVVYWNYQSPTCGQHGGGSLTQNQSGAIFRAARYDVDFALIELTQAPDPNFRVYYSGWQCAGSNLVGCVGIHHPNTDEKSISFSSNTVTTVNSCIGTGDNTHYEVVWSLGVTEHGSSGSGIWEPSSHRLVGALSGGGSDCTTPLAPDCYGKFAMAWDSGTMPEERLQNWLDPLNTGVRGVPGRDPILPAGALLVAESCAPTNRVIDSGESVTVSFALRNTGGAVCSNLVATLLATNGVALPSTPQYFGDLAAGGPAISRAFSFTASAACGSTIFPVLQLKDASGDFGMARFQFTLGTPKPQLTWAENFDGVVAPALAAGWITTGTTNWITSTNREDTLPNSAYVTSPGNVSDNQLTSPFISIAPGNAQLSVRHYYSTESGFDGGVLELSINGGPFNDILNAGGTFLSGPYNQVIPSTYGNPLAGRAAWGGDSGGFITTTVSLPLAAAGQTIQLRWRLGSDTSVGSTGWYVDTISVSNVFYNCCVAAPVILDPRPGAGSMSFSYDTVLGKTYYVQTVSDPLSSNWTSVQTTLGDGSRQSYTNDTTAANQLFFRLRTE